MVKFKICIDPGHGGYDRANRGPTGFVEADGNLALALQLKTDLESTGEFEVRLTRETDIFVGLRDRARIARLWGADLFLSLHSNADSGTACGSEALYSVDHPEDQVLAANITKRIAVLFSTKDRGAKARPADPAHPGASGATTADPEDYYAVIDEAEDRGIPHIILMETLFHDNPQEEALLKLPMTTKLLSGAIASEIQAAYGVPEAVREVLLAREFVLTNKISDGLLGATPLTREQIWVMLYRMSKVLGVK